MQSVIQAPDKGEKDGEHGQGTVSITIDNPERPIWLRRGMHDVSELKTLGGVPQDYDLDQVIEGKLVPVTTEKVHIRGGEVFTSHPKDSGSS
jgi:hypothetical protein